MKALRMKLFMLVVMSLRFSSISGDSALYSALLNVYSSAPNTGDCNPQKTTATLKFLSLQDTDMKSNDLKEDKAGVKIDCSMRLTNLPKLRQFLMESGFVNDPGSLVFLNSQDTQLKLTCSGDENDEAKFRWKLYGSKEDNKFFKAPYEGNILHIPAPVDYEYFRKYTCFSKKKKCIHTYYVITRPHVKMTFPIQIDEDGKFDDPPVTCTLSDCTAGKCKIGDEHFNSNHQLPYEYFWRVPPGIMKTKGTKAAEYDCAKAGDKDEKEKPVYLDTTSGLDKGNFIDGIEFLPPKPEDKKLKKKDGTDEGQVIIRTAQFKVSKAKIEHTGHYECIVVDKNGVPSTPTHGSLHKHERYTGRTKLHVRKFIFTIIPTVFVCLILLLMLIIWIVYRKEDRMENDDGTLLKNEEEVTPENSGPQEKGQPPTQSVSLSKQSSKVTKA